MTAARSVLPSSATGSVRRWPVHERDQSDRCRVDDGSYSWEAPAGDGTAGAAAPLLEHAASLDDALVALTRHARWGLGTAILGAQLRARCWRRRATRCCSWGHTTVNQRPSRECWLVSMARSCPRQLCLRPSLGSCCGHPALADTRGRAQPVARGEWSDSNYVQRVAEGPDRDGIDLEFDVLHGDHPSRSIEDHANLQPGTLTALANHGHSGVRWITMGSMAMEATRRVTGPTLVVRPSWLGAFHEAASEW